MFDLFQAAQHWLVGKIVELFATEIVGPALHVTDPQFGCAIGIQGLLEKGDIFVEELFLEVLGSSGDQNPLAGTDYGEQVGERLAGAGAGFHDQVTLLFECLLDGLRHLELSVTKFVGRMRAGQQASRRKELVQRAFLPGAAGRGLGSGSQGVSIIPTTQYPVPGTQRTNFLGEIPDQLDNRGRQPGAGSDYCHRGAP